MRNDYKKRKYRIDPITNCWNWILSTDSSGYGKLQLKGTRRTISAHKFYYEQKFGKVPEGMQLDHLCKNRKCVNPEHLEVVTRKENVHRGLNTKLTDEQIKEIREHIIKYPQEKQKYLAEKYNVSRSHISNILNKLTRI